MSRFDQVFVIPIYQTSLILINLLSAAIILQESKFYSASQMLWLLAMSCVCILGVVLTVRKPSSVCGIENCVITS